MKLGSMFIGVVAAAASAITVVSVAPTAQASDRGPGLTDTSQLEVLYNGSTLTNDQAVAKQNLAEQNEQEFVLVYDPASSLKGVAHAFDTRAAADRFGAAQQPKIAALKNQRTTSTARTTQALGPLPTTCPTARNISRMYDGYNCAGSVFNFLLTDNEPDFSTYGWNNKGNSLVVGYTSSGCTILVRLYPGPNYTYTEARFYGSSSSEYYRFNSAQTNNFESGRSTCS